MRKIYSFCCIIALVVGIMISGTGEILHKPLLINWSCHRGLAKIYQRAVQGFKLLVICYTPRANHLLLSGGYAII